MNPEVLVTGIGLVTPAGVDRETTWAAVLAGRSTSARDSELAGLSVDLACRVGKLDHPVLQRDATNLDPVTRFALAATAEALAHAGLDPAVWDGSRVAVVTGGSFGGMSVLDAAVSCQLKGDPEDVSPYFLPSYLMNMASATIAIRFGATGPSLSAGTACASGATAVGVAGDLLAAGRCDLAIVCGADAAITRLVVTGFAQLRALSNRASRPFDSARDGFVIAEGAGALVLECSAHAKARGAEPLARLLGYGSSTDAHHLVAPHPEGRGAEAAIGAALHDAGLTFTDVGHVNAHGSSTQLNDRVEASLIGRLFPHRPPVTSAKGSLGHTLGAAGAIEAALTVLTLREGAIPPTAGLDEVDPRIDAGIDVVARSARRQEVRVAISNSFGMGGHNAVSVFAKV
ncbi:beta-ketoacyl-[acyl-carrier-protein] synthase family protein [Streptomyces sp. NPDC005900]|uniref:beta-ketoacyl-[acyl-carrier-protein] synthase family protein n=1 Tax=Streptomyces sp. NPDC005900 TaxID=3154569 RepID=UPI00340BEBC3